MKKIRTHYDNLQVIEKASIEAIKGAYKHLSHKYHPDKNLYDREKAEKVMKLLNQAYKVLSDPELRKEHDAWIKVQRVKQKNQGDDKPDFQKEYEANEKNYTHDYDNSNTNNATDDNKYHTNSKANNSDLVTCCSCGRSISKLADTCPICGKFQKNKKAKATKTQKTQKIRSKNVAALWAVFLGGFGAHKFYLGQWAQGILYLVLAQTGISAIVGFVEGLYFFFMKDEVWQEKYEKGTVLLYGTSIFIIVSIGFVAMISIPAYQDYVERQKNIENNRNQNTQSIQQAVKENSNTDRIDSHVSTPNNMEEIPLEMQQWIDRNPWFGRDEVKTKVANKQYDSLIADGWRDYEPGTYRRLDILIADEINSITMPSDNPASLSENGIELVKVPSGCFYMGANNSEQDEKPAHRVCITKDFYMGKYEVTYEQWQAIMGDNPSHNNKDNYPVGGVSWDNVQEFIRKLNIRTGQYYRLPTEAEWEYACRSGGKDEKYCGSNSIDSVAWYSKNSGGWVHQAGQKQANGLGLYDMSGNLWEWVQDWHDNNYYQNSPEDDPLGSLVGSFHVVRGGGYKDMASRARSTNRFGIKPEYRKIGFRLARSSY